MLDYALGDPLGEEDVAGGPSVAAAIQAIDHSAAAVSRLVEQFKKPKIIKLVQSFLTPLAAIEETAADMMLMRSIDLAEGVQLQRIAKLVGQPIIDVDTSTFRRYIRARVKVKRSSGTGPQLLEILGLVVGDPTAMLTLNNQGYATVAMRVGEAILSTSLPYRVVNDFLGLAVAGGVRVVLDWSPVAPADRFTYDTFVPGSAVGKGWGDVNDPLTGGAYSGSADNS